MGLFRRMEKIGVIGQRISVRAAMAFVVATAALGIAVDDVLGEDSPSKRVAKRSANETTGEDNGAQEHPLTKPLQIIKQSREALEDVKDYTATFSKRERLGRGGRQLLAQTMRMKFREEPFSGHLYFQTKDRFTARHDVLCTQRQRRDEGEPLSDHKGRPTQHGR